MSALRCDVRYLPLPRRFGDGDFVLLDETVAPVGGRLEAVEAVSARHPDCCRSDLLLNQS